VSVRGNAETVALVDLLNLIHGAGHAGTLRLQIGERTAKLHFYRGQIYLPTGGSRGAYRIGALLVRAGKLGGRDLLRALQIQKSEGHRERLGDLLVRQEMVTRQDLDEVIRTQFEEEICDLLFEEQADFEFKKGVLPAGFADSRGNIQALGFDTRSILMEASRRQDEWRRIRSMIPSTKSFLRASEITSGTWHVDSSGRVQSGSDSGRVLESPTQQILARWRSADALFEQCPFDGTRSVEEIIAASGVSAFVAMGVVAQLRQEGHIRELTAAEIEQASLEHLREGRNRLAYKVYEWANESDRLRPIAARLDKVFLRREYLDGASFTTQAPSVRALQILSRLLRRAAPFRFLARESDSLVEVYYTPERDGSSGNLRLHLMGPRRTHSTVRYLRRRRAISSGALDQAKAKAMSSGRKLDRVLVEDGFVDRRIWIRAVKDKVISGLFSVFGWSLPHIEVQGGVVAPPAPEDVPEGLVCEIPIDADLQESIKRDLLRWKLLLQKIPTPDAIFLCTSPTPSDKRRRAHDLFDGRRSVGDLIQLARVAPLELVRFVYDCSQAKRIRPLSDREHYVQVEEAQEAGRLDEAIAFCKSAVAFGYAPKLYDQRLKELRKKVAARGPKAETRHVLEGALSSFSLAEVFQLLHQGRRTGTLKIQSQDQERVFYLDEGKLFVFNAESSEAEQEVWDLLMGDETRMSLDLEAVLQRRGSLAEEDLDAEQRASIKEDIFEAFMWEDATFNFTQNLLPSEIRLDDHRGTKLALNTDALLFEAMSRMAEWDELRETLKSSQAVFRYASPEAQMRAVQGSDLGAAAYLFDGKHTLDSVVRISKVNRFKLYRAARDLVQSNTLALVVARDRSHPGRSTSQRRAVMASGRIPRLEDSARGNKRGRGRPRGRPRPGPRGRPPARGRPRGRGRVSSTSSPSLSSDAEMNITELGDSMEEFTSPFVDP
jgi:Domain of unknown function (DUF4388)